MIDFVLGKAIKRDLKQLIRFWRPFLFNVAPLEIPSHCKYFYTFAKVSLSELKRKKEEILEVYPCIQIPQDKLSFSFSRSSGPGGQNVNKVNTKAELRFNVNEAAWLPPGAKERLKQQHSGRITKSGEFVITSVVHRTQADNIKECMKRLEMYVQQANRIPIVRRKTILPAYAKEERLREKKRKSQLKKDRSWTNW